MAGVAQRVKNVLQRLKGRSAGTPDAQRVKRAEHVADARAQHRQHKEHARDSALKL
jgi:hypothetical protein